MKKLAHLLFFVLVSCNSKTVELSVENKMEIILQSEITCTKCGHKETETMPTDVCLIKYSCKVCKYEMFPKEGDCCVFCSYSNHKCPPEQVNQ